MPSEQKQDVPAWFRKHIADATYAAGVLLRGTDKPRVVRLIGWALAAATVADRWTGRVLGSVSWPDAVHAYEHGELHVSEVGPFVEARYVAHTPAGASNGK